MKMRCKKKLSDVLRGYLSFGNDDLLFFSVLIAKAPCDHYPSRVRTFRSYAPAIVNTQNKLMRFASVANCRALHRNCLAYDVVARMISFWTGKRLLIISVFNHGNLKPFLIELYGNGIYCDCSSVFIPKPKDFTTWSFVVPVIIKSWFKVTDSCFCLFLQQLVGCSRLLISFTRQIHRRVQKIHRYSGGKCSGPTTQRPYPRAITLPNRLLRGPCCLRAASRVKHSPCDDQRNRNERSGKYPMKRLHTFGHSTARLQMGVCV